MIEGIQVTLETRTKGGLGFCPVHGPTSVVVRSSRDLWRILGRFVIQISNLSTKRLGEEKNDMTLGRTIGPT